MSAVPYVGIAAPIDIEPKNQIQNPKIRYSLTIKYNNKISYVGTNSPNTNIIDELVVILMNPSEADMYYSDNTINNVILYLQRYCNNLIILNLSPVYSKAPGNLAIAQLAKFNQKNINEITKNITGKSKHILLAYGVCDTKNKMLNSFFALRQQWILTTLNELSQQQDTKIYTFGQLNKNKTPIHFANYYNKLCGRTLNERQINTLSNGQVELL